MPKNKKFWQFRNTADNPKAGELLLYGDISSTTWWGDEITPKQFKEDLDAMGDVNTINVYINSGGGDTFAGQAIYSMLKRHKATVNVYVDGLAASIASVIAMAGDKVYMPVNAMMMVHNPWTWGIGDANEFRELATILDQVRKTIVATYQAKTGMDEEKIIELMDAETWMTAKEAVEYGFADEIEEAKQIAASLDKSFLVMNSQRFDLSRFKHTPEAIAGLPATIKDGVVPSDVSREKAPEDEPWERLTLSDFTDESWDDLSEAEKRRIAGHFAWANEMPPEMFGNLKLGHHRASDGAVVWRGVANAAARLNQADIPQEDVAEVQAHLGSHYRQFGRTPPWEEEDKVTGNINVSVTVNIQNKDPDLPVIVEQPQKDKQTDNGLLYLYAAKVKVNKNKIRR
jgi:ATP-dependent Clp protease protease subunit